MKWRKLAALPLLLALAGCQGEDAQQAPTVTVTQSTQAAATENPMCDDVRLQRDINHTLAAGGYSEDYAATYDQMLNTLGCTTP